MQYLVQVRPPDSPSPMSPYYGIEFIEKLIEELKTQAPEAGMSKPGGGR